MVHKQLSKWTAALVAVLVVFGIARAANSHYVERRSAFYQSLDGERKRLGLTDRARLKAQYPTPEISLCHAAHVAPGGTANVLVKGKFSVGSKFLFENDDVEVVNEHATATEYTATVRAVAGAGPEYSPLHVFAAVSGIEAVCPAVYIGGKYEWDFTAQNGWKIKVVAKSDPFPKDGEDPVARYTAEFYRPNESKPFDVRDLRLGLSGPLYGNNYGGALDVAAGSAGDPMADMQALMAKLYDPKTSEAERQQLAQKMSQVSEQMTQQGSQMQQKAQQENDYGCKSISFGTGADPVEGKLTCGSKVGNLPVKGTRRFVGQ